ncbi:ABC transporter permease [Pseudaestuariivita rosea]|uniref:ABC transporter permease n=1 Tax=Pseudaestuariivita rosea TaxID=2763263 RepID=UPI001ABA9B12|nr:ABC transporter permease [Pseudaestuariivita rosea]
MEPIGWIEIITRLLAQLTPVLITLAALLAISFLFKRKLGLYGKLYDSWIGIIGFTLVMFWVFTGLFGAFDLIMTHDPLSIPGDQIEARRLQNALPGTPFTANSGEYPYYLLGGDHQGRDVFSRMVDGAWTVILIAPCATLFAFMAGIILGLPAGYYGGRLDTVLTFLANLVLSFPVILLFYLLVTPEITDSALPRVMAGILFLFPIIFLIILLNSRFYTQPTKRNILLAVTVLFGGWIYLGTAWNADPLGVIVFPANILIVFVAVVFVNSPTVFRIVRGLTFDIKTRDYVAAAQTRGEGNWYIMLWEILPNVRGPLIVDFCLRIGYTTILLGTLGFFGLGLSPESSNWGATISAGSDLLRRAAHPAVVPALALLTLVLGLNMLADGLREESLKD